MTEPRRKWDKPTHDTTFIGTTTNVQDDPVLEKQRQYIKMLEERNRLKKKLAAASKKETQREREREEAFVTTFNVATGITTHHDGNRKNRSAGRMNEIRETKSREPIDTRGRAKWNRPVAMAFTRDYNGDGKEEFRLKQEKEKEEEEEAYLNESFEEEEEEEEDKKTESKDTIQTLYDMIHHLSRDKQTQLIHVLQQYESSRQQESDKQTLQRSIHDVGVWKQLTQTLFQDQPKVVLSHVVEQIETKKTEMEEEMELERLIQQKRQERRLKGQETISIHLRLLSTYTITTRSIGLTQICAYDHNGHELEIDPTTLQLYRGSELLSKSHEMVRTLTRLVDGMIQTNDEQHMWQGRLSDSGMMEIVFQVPSVPSKLCIWNYNSKTQASCGVRDMEVWMQGKWIWTGSLAQAYGKEDENICTWISMIPNNKKTTRSEQKESRVEKESSGPIWLNTSSTPRTCTLLSDTKESISTSRRIREEEKQVKEESNPLSPSTWDTLERFSKTSRSRLPSHSEEQEKALLTSSLLDPLRSSLSKPMIEIPVLPRGMILVMEILTTWGDPYYVGLNGIEFFNEQGQMISFSSPSQQVIASPASINVLDEYENDPRVASNLVDGINCTCDDLHMWLAPFTQGKQHSITFQFSHLVAFSMIRIWNYNKSRAHTSRGVRHARLILTHSSSRVIFDGEIQKAPGLVTSRDDSWCEVILFTTDRTILERIEANDVLVKASGKEQVEEQTSRAIIARVRQSMELQRPRTSDHSEQKEQSTTSTELSWIKDSEPQQVSPKPISYEESTEEEEEEEEEEETEEEEDLITGRRIVIRLLSTWGDVNYIGLTQLDVLVGRQGTPLRLESSQVDATPRDLATLGYHGDPRTLDKLVDGVGQTCEDTHMWLIPFSNHTPYPELRIDLKREQRIYGISIWNYNKSLEDTFRGVKQVEIRIDGHLIRRCIIRKAPGNTLFSFDHILRFQSSSQRIISSIVSIAHRTYKTPLLRQDYEPVLYPQGFILKFIIWSTWGDSYYLGLNGIELYDEEGKRIVHRPIHITAKPYSVNDLQMTNDVRIPENLWNEGKNKNTWEASNAWLAPLASSLGSTIGNQLYLVFDRPMTLSCIKIWNYSKTPERGGKDIDIYMDDLHLYSGTLRKVPSSPISQGRKIPLVVDDFSQSIVFSSNQAQVDQEKRRVYYCGQEEQDVLCINEGQVIHESKAMYRKPDPGAEGVIVDLNQRPMTAMIGSRA